VESDLHRRLKHAAVELLRQSGCVVAATEVACPIHRSRVDAAGYLDAQTNSRPAPQPAATAMPAIALPPGQTPRTAIIEVKVSLADLQSDAHDPARLRHRRAMLARRLAEVREQFVKPIEPSLRQAGATLFEQTDPWDFSACRSSNHRALATALQRAERQQRVAAKLASMARYRLANWLYVLAPHPSGSVAGILPEHVPAGWGLLYADANGQIGIARPAPLLDTPAERVQRLLRNLAVALMRPSRLLGPPPAAAVPLVPTAPRTQA
jgi:hypothetical protein